MLSPLSLLRWPRSAWALLVSMASLVSLAGLGHALPYMQPFEDAFITYRYADHLAHGQGLTYNAGEYVEGFSSFFWTLLLALTSWLGFEPVWISEALSMASAWGVLGVTAALTFRVVREDDPNATPFDALLSAGGAALLVVSSGTCAYWAGTGMEATFFTLVLTTALYLAGSLSRRAPAWLGVALAIGAMTRPEGVGYAVVLLGTLAWLEGTRRRALTSAWVFAIVFLPYFAWRWMHFGYLAPNTYYAKAQLSIGVLRNGLRDVESFLTMTLFWVVPVAFVFLLRKRTAARASFALAATVVGCAVVNAVIVGGDTFYFHRFLLPAIPAGAFGIVMAVRKVAHHAKNSPERRRRGVAMGVAVVLLFCLGVASADVRPVRTLLTHRMQSERALVSDLRAYTDDYFAIGEWLKGAMPPETVLATNAAGIVPYVSGLRTIDMLGLTDVHIAHVPIELGKAGAIGHEKHDAAYVLAQRPDVVFLGLPRTTPAPIAQGEVERWFSQWFRFLPGDRDIFYDEGFRRTYAPVGAKVGPGKFFLFFVRRKG